MATSYHGYLGQRQVQSTQQLHLLASLMGELSTGPGSALCLFYPPQDGPAEAGGQEQVPVGP